MANATNEVRSVRAAIERNGAGTKQRLTDAQIEAMIADCRTKLGSSCTPATLLECAVARATDVVGELGLGADSPPKG
jgi:hypothetical protein